MNTRYSTPGRVCAVFYVFRARQKPQMSGFGAALSFCADLPDSAEKKSPAGCLLFPFKFFRKKTGLRSCRGSPG